MKLVLAVTFASVLIPPAVAQQQSPFAPPLPQAPATQPNAGQTTTPANQGVATNPTGDPTTPGQAVLPTEGTGAPAGTRSAFGLTNQLQGGAGSAPLFLNVTPTTVTDANGSPIGVLQQLALTPTGNVNFGIVNMGGRLVPVPWQLIVSSSAGRGSLSVNADTGLLRTAPPVAMGQIPLLADQEVQARIFGHFAAQDPNTQPTVVTTGTARGGTGGSGVTITGGSTNAATFNTNAAFSTNRTAITTNAPIPNNTRSNQAVNTTGGLLSPTGRTNAAFDGFNSGPGSTDRFGPRQNANPTTTPPPPTAPPPRAPVPVAPPPQPTAPQ